MPQPTVTLGQEVPFLPPAVVLPLRPAFLALGVGNILNSVSGTGVVARGKIMLADRATDYLNAFDPSNLGGPNGIIIYNTDVIPFTPHGPLSLVIGRHPTPPPFQGRLQTLMLSINLHAAVQTQFAGLQPGVIVRSGCRPLNLQRTVSGPPGFCPLFYSGYTQWRIIRGSILGSSTTPWVIDTNVTTILSGAIDGGGRLVGLADSGTFDGIWWPDSSGPDSVTWNDPGRTTWVTGEPWPGQYFDAQQIMILQVTSDGIFQNDLNDHMQSNLFTKCDAAPGPDPCP